MKAATATASSPSQSSGSPSGIVSATTLASWYRSNHHRSKDQDRRDRCPDLGTPWQSAQDSDVDRLGRVRGCQRDASPDRNGFATRMTSLNSPYAADQHQPLQPTLPACQSSQQDGTWTSKPWGDGASEFSWKVAMQRPVTRHTRTDNPSLRAGLSNDASKVGGSFGTGRGVNQFTLDVQTSRNGHGSDPETTSLAAGTIPITALFQHLTIIGSNAPFEQWPFVHSLQCMRPCIAGRFTSLRPDSNCRAARPSVGS